jgi:predicted dehydrogenase
MLDVIVWLFGAPSTVMVQQENTLDHFQENNSDDISNITMSWDDTTSFSGERPENLIGHVHLSPVGRKAEDVFDVTGTAGMLMLEGKNCFAQRRWYSNLRNGGYLDKGRRHTRHAAPVQ